MHNNINVNVGGVSSMEPCTYKSVILKKNIIDNENVLTQTMINEYGKNTKFIIKWDYTIGGSVSGVADVTTVSPFPNPGYAAAHEAWMAADNAYTNNPNETTLAAKNAAYAVLQANPQYWSYDSRQITLNKYKQITIPEGCVLLNSSGAVVEFDNNVADRNISVFIASLVQGEYNYTIGNAIVMPSGCLIELDGGSIANGVIVGNETILIYNQPLNEVLTATLEGTWRHESGVKADEEDITDLNGELKLKDRGTTDGMGRIILRKNKSFAEQLTQENTIYEIRYDFDLNEADVTIPKNCILEFDGGSISNGILDLNDCQVNGCGLSCEIRNPFGKWIKTSQCLINDSENNANYNTSAFQKLIDNGISIIIDSDIYFSQEINITNPIKIQGNVERPTLYFNNSRGFVWNVRTYYGYGYFKNLKIVSNSHCFDFFNDNGLRPFNIYGYLFSDIEISSNEGCGFYGGTSFGAGNDQLIFSCSFKDINILKATSGFYGIRGICNTFENVTAWKVTDSVIRNCSGIFISCNGVSQNSSPYWGYFTQNNMSYSLIFKNCNFESTTAEIFRNIGVNSFIYWDFESCNFYPAYNNTTLKIEKFPLDIYIFSYLSFNNCNVYIPNNVSYATSICFIRTTLATDTWPTIKTDKQLSISRNNFIYRISQTTSKQISFTSDDYYTPKVDVFIPRLTSTFHSTSGLMFTKKDITIGDEENFALNGNLYAYYNAVVSSSTDLATTTKVIRYCTGLTLNTSNIYRFIIRNGCTNAKLVIVHNENYSGRFCNECGSNIVLKPREFVFVESIYDGSNYRYFVHNKVSLNVNKKGATVDRPLGTNIYVGFMYMDTTLGKPIYASAISGDTVTWVDATGATV